MSLRILFILGCLACIVSGAAETSHFLGANSCSSSGCHGGAADRSSQYLAWSRVDFHSRAFATLTSARSERIGETLKITAAAQSERCTVCHAPFQTLGSSQKIHPTEITAGVSCESCHGAASEWIRSHTRPDLSHEKRVALGMRDLRDFYVRANTCVACHQNVDEDLRAAGHPELIFELDGQTAAQPRHWKEKEAVNGKAWFVGQAVALREISWELARHTNAVRLRTPWIALVTVLKQLGTADAKFAALKSLPSEWSLENLERTRGIADEMAKAGATWQWEEEMSERCVTALVGLKVQFERALPRETAARVAERLVLALDRLTPPTDPTAGEKLDKMFQAVQSLPDFDPSTFASLLAGFEAKPKNGSK